MHNIETKNKIRTSVIKSHKEQGHIPQALVCENCSQCFTVIFSKRNQKCCSRSCSMVIKNKKLKLGIKGGLASANKRVLRSKNEIYFFELCKAHFTNIEHNVPVFNGWDADIIIHDIKTAVLWNGKWHYEKITKSHSVKQVQNRDKIKLAEIHKAGYSAYTVKDMGKFNKGFVEAEFEKFLQKQKG